MYQIINIFISAIITVVGTFYFAKIVLNERIKITKKEFIGLLIMTTILYAIVIIYLNGTIKTLVLFTITIFFYKGTFRLNNYKAILIGLIYTIMLVIADLFTLFIVIKLPGVTKSSYYTSFAGGMFGTLLVYIVFIMITYMLKKPLKKLIASKIDNNKKLIVLSISTLICVLLFFYTLIKEFRFSDNIITYLIAMVIMIVMLGNLIKQIMYNDKLIDEYDNLLSLMKTFEKEIENQRILRHEIKNEFRTIRAKISENQDNEEIIKYIDEIVKDKYTISKEKYAKFGYLPPNGIKGLCYFKVQDAENKGIDVDINISKKVENSTIFDLNIKEERDFGRILGVYLDNAIEASAQSSKKEMGFEAYANLDKELKIIISNTYDNDIDEEKLGQESFSTKGKTRGHGLLLVRQLINRNKRFEAKTEMKDNIYTQTIEIKKIIDE